MQKRKQKIGDVSYNTTGNSLIDILFMSEYYSKHLKEVRIGDSEKEKLFSMFIRDGRHGIGKRDLGRRLMYLSEVKAEDIVKAGRFDDLYLLTNKYLETDFDEHLPYLFEQIKNGNELAKKWAPRLNSKNKKYAKLICRLNHISEKKYRELIKCDTVENKLSRHRIDDIIFEHVPSLAMIKYYNRFMKEDRFKEYLESVKKGEKKLNVSTTTVYDIYRNRNKIDADLFFDKLEKISISCVPIIDTSASMTWGDTDAYGKALSIGHYLAKCSTYCNGYAISFSNRPRLMKIEGENYTQQIRSLHTGDCSNTDFGKVMNLLEELEELPEYLVVLSDMEFDQGSCQSKNKLQQLWKQKGYTTKIVWWNFNSRNTTVPELDENGNIYLSGYNPYLLKFLEAGFDGEQFLNRLLDEYKNNLEK